MLTISEKSEEQGGEGERRELKAERGSRPTPGVLLTRHVDFPRGMLQTDVRMRGKWQTDPRILRG